MNDTKEKINDVILSMDDMELVLRTQNTCAKIAISQNLAILRVQDEELDITESPSIDNVIELVTENMDFPLFSDSGYMYEESELREELRKMGLK